jgi:maleate isomerase
MTAFPFTLQDDDLPRLGLIVLQVDETIELDFRRMFPPHVAQVHVTRVPSGLELTPDTIADMECALPNAASLLPSAQAFDVIAYGCTSGTTLIGADKVRALVMGSARTRAVTDPLTATLARCHALGLGRVGILSPYIPSVAEPIRAAFERAGIVVPDTLSFGEQVEARVARISAASISKAAHTLAGRTKLDAVFLSCTNLRTLDILDRLSRELGVPVLSSNSCLGIHMATLAGLPTLPTVGGMQDQR